jgi:hypothetical protein
MTTKETFMVHPEYAKRVPKHNMTDVKWHKHTSILMPGLAHAPQHCRSCLAHDKSGGIVWFVLRGGSNVRWIVMR